MQGECFLCGQWGYTETHHLFGKENRKKSTKYGLTVNLCINCHRTGRNAVHQCEETMDYLHEYGQRKWQEEQGKTADDFYKEFGRYYL